MSESKASTRSEGMYGGMWSRINENMTAADRQLFNNWRFELYFLADRSRDALRASFQDCNIAIGNELMNAVCDIPRLER